MALARYEYALTVVDPQAQGTITSILGAAALESIVQRLHASIAPAVSIRARSWFSGVTPPHVHITFSVPTAGTNYRAQVIASLPSNVAADVNAGRLRLDGRVYDSDFTGDMGAPSGAGWTSGGQASWAIAEGPAPSPTPDAPRNVCGFRASADGIAGYIDEWGSFGGTNAVPVPLGTTGVVLGRSRHAVSGPSDRRMIQLQMTNGALAGRKLWVVAEEGFTQAARAGGCAAVDTYAPDSRANPDPSPAAPGSTSNPTPSPPPAPLQPVQPAQAGMGGGLAGLIIVGSLGGIAWMVYDKMKRGRRRS